VATEERVRGSVIAVEPAPRVVRPGLMSAVLWTVIVAVLAARQARLGDVPAFATFGVIFASIVVEALPFILLGALVSAAVAV
jgi:hypothetical protein